VTIPVWKLTRTSVGRHLFDSLADIGVVFSRLAQFDHALESPLPARSVPEEVSLRVGSPEEFSLSGRLNRPALADHDLVVAAVADDRVVGVQPITLDRTFYVEPLERPLDFPGAYFWGLSVVPEWRRRGVATALVARALAVVAEQTAQPSVQTLVGIDNAPSKQVLRGVGFERTGVRSYYRLFGWQHSGRV